MFLSSLQFFEFAHFNRLISYVYDFSQHIENKNVTGSSEVGMRFA